MAEDYDEIVARQIRKKFTAEDYQRARYGSQIDRERYIFWQVVRRYARFAVAGAGFAVATATLWKIWHGG
jgi:hypothetical protein